MSQLVSVSFCAAAFVACVFRESQAYGQIDSEKVGFDDVDGASLVQSSETGLGRISVSQYHDVFGDLDDEFDGGKGLLDAADGILTQTVGRENSRLSLPAHDDLFELDDEFDESPTIVRAAFDATHGTHLRVWLLDAFDHFQLPSFRALASNFVLLAILSCWTWKLISVVFGPFTAREFNVTTRGRSKRATNFDTRCSAHVDFVALRHACNDISQLRAELDAIPNVASATDEFGCTALHVAAEIGSEELVKVLLKSCCSVDVSEAWEDTPLHFAARAGHTAICKLLLSNGADIHRVNSNEESPLLASANAGKDETSTFLFENGGHGCGVPDSKLPPLFSALLVQRMVAPCKQGFVTQKDFTADQRADDIGE